MADEDFRDWHGDVLAMIAEGLPAKAIVKKILATATTPDAVARYLEHLRFSAECFEQDVSGASLGIVEVQGMPLDLDESAASTALTLKRLREVISRLEGSPQ